MVTEAAPRAPDGGADAAQALSQESAGIILVSDDDEEVVMKAKGAVQADLQRTAPAPVASGLQDACGPVEDTQVDLQDGIA